MYLTEKIIIIAALAGYLKRLSHIILNTHYVFDAFCSHRKQQQKIEPARIIHFGLIGNSICYGIKNRLESFLISYSYTTGVMSVFFVLAVICKYLI